MATWDQVGARLGAPGVRRDPGPGRVLLAAAIVGVLWAQGGLLRSIAAMVLAAVLILPGPDGKSLLRVTAKGIEDILKG